IRHCAPPLAAAGDAAISAIAAASTIPRPALHIPGGESSPCLRGVRRFVCCRARLGILSPVTSDQNVEIVRSIYDDWARGDFSQGDAFHPDVEFDMTDWPGGGSARGVEGMRRAWMESLRAWEDFRAE